MAGTKGYREKIAEHIANVVADRRIEHVLHFTRLENLPNILAHGLLRRSELVNADFDVYASDADRLDKEDGAVSVSISCYYPRMFEAKRHREKNKPWAILILSPSLLWDYHCLFYSRGAATNEVKYENSRRYGGYALERLFEEAFFSMDPKGVGLRGKHDLPPSWPTFSDSEVQVMSPIRPSYIDGAWVETPEQRELVQTVFNAAGREECWVEDCPFEPRICGKPYFWG